MAGPAAPLGANFRSLWTAAAVSNLADGVFQVALPLLALRLTDSPAAIAGLAFAARLPWLLVSLHAGALADRLDRRRTMVRVDVGRAVLIGGLALLAGLGHEQLWVLYVVAFVLGVGETLFDTSAQSVLPAVVAPADLSRANGRLSVAETALNNFVGPPLGGLLAGVAIAAAFTTSAVGYLVAAVALALMTGSFRAERAGPPTRLRADIAEGLRYLRGHRLLRTLAAMVGISMLCSTATFSLFPLFAVAPGPLGLSEAGFGILLTASGVGGLIGSALAARVEERLGRRRVLILCVVADSVAIAAIATGVLPIVAAAGVVLGATLVLWIVVTVSLRQRIVPDHLLGRVNSAYRMVALGAMPLGALVGGLLAEVVGLRPVFVGSGVLAASQLLLMRSITDESIAAAEAAATALPRPAVSPPSPM